MPLPRRSGGSFLQTFGSGFPQQDVEVIHDEGGAEERRFQMRAIIQSKTGQFNYDAQIFEGDIVELADPRGGTRRLLAESVNVVDADEMSHISATWGKIRQPLIPNQISNVYNGPVIEVHGDGAQLAWGNETLTQTQRSESIAAGYEEIAQIASELLKYVRASGMNQEDQSIFEETATEVLHEVVRSYPNRSLIRRGLAVLRGLGEQLLGSFEAGDGDTTRTAAEETLASLRRVAIPE